MKKYVSCVPWAKGFVHLFLKGKMLQSFLTRLEKTIMSLIEQLKGNPSPPTDYSSLKT